MKEPILLLILLGAAWTAGWLITFATTFVNQPSARHTFRARMKYALLNANDLLGRWRLPSAFALLVSQVLCCFTSIALWICIGRIIYLFTGPPVPGLFETPILEAVIGVSLAVHVTAQVLAFRAALD